MVNKHEYSMLPDFQTPAENVIRCSYWLGQIGWSSTTSTQSLTMNWDVGIPCIGLLMKSAVQRTCLITEKVLD